MTAVRDTAQREKAELRAYLGDQFDLSLLQRYEQQLDDEWAGCGDEGDFYRTSHGYLYNLTAFAMTGTKDPYHQALRSIVDPGARLLDYGCGIGSDGLAFLEAGYRVEFADFDNPSVEYLRWRLRRRGLSARIHNLDEGVPGGFDLAYSFDVIEHVADPFAFLEELERRAGLALVNLLEPEPGETELHHELPIPRLLRYVADRELRLYELHHRRSHLVAYRPRLVGSVARTVNDARIKLVAFRSRIPSL